MPANNSPLNDADDDIIELVDIIEKGTVPSSVVEHDTKTHASMHDLDQELDNMFGDAPSTPSQQATSSPQNDDLDDFNSIFNDSLAESSNTQSAAPRTADTSADDDFLDLFSEPLTDKKAQKPQSPPSMDDLETLLMGNPTQSAESDKVPSLANAMAADEMDLGDLDALLSGSPAAQSSGTPSKTEALSNDEMDMGDLDALLSGDSTPSLNVAKKAAPANLPTDNAAHDFDDRPMDDLDALLSGGMSASSSTAKDTKKSTDDALFDLDELLAEPMPKSVTPGSAKNAQNLTENTERPKKMPAPANELPDELGMDDLDAFLSGKMSTSIGASKGTTAEAFDLNDDDAFDMDELLAELPVPKSVKAGGAQSTQNLTEQAERAEKTPAPVSLPADDLAADLPDHTADISMDDLDELLSGSMPVSASDSKDATNPFDLNDDADFDMDELLAELPIPESVQSVRAGGAKNTQTDPRQKSPAQKTEELNFESLDNLLSDIEADTPQSRKSPDAAAAADPFAFEISSDTAETAEQDLSFEDLVEQPAAKNAQAPSMQLEIESEMNMAELDNVVDSLNVPEDGASPKPLATATDLLDLDSLLAQVTFDETEPAEAQTAKTRDNLEEEISLQDLEHLDVLLATASATADLEQEDLNEAIAQMGVSIEQVPSQEESRALERIASQLQPEQPKTAKQSAMRQEMERLETLLGEMKKLADEEDSLQVLPENASVLEDTENPVLDDDLLSMDALDEILTQDDELESDTDNLPAESQSANAYSAAQIDTMERELFALRDQLDEFARGMAAVEARISSIEASEQEQDEPQTSPTQLFEDILNGQNPLGAQLVSVIRNVLTADLAPRVETLVRAQLQEYEERQAEALAAVGTSIPAEAETLVPVPDAAEIAEQVRSALLPDIERMAASAAAQIIREEIMNLLQGE